MVKWSGGFLTNIFTNPQRGNPPPNMQAGRGAGSAGAGPGPPPGHGPPLGQYPPILRHIRPIAARLTRAQQRELAQFEAGKIKRYFDRYSDHYEYERYLSNGVTGVSCKIRLKPNGDRTSQYFVVKRTYRENTQQYLIEERRILQLFRGAQHILQLFHIGSSIYNPLMGDPGVSIFTEWIESGTLRDFIFRIRDQPRPLPNRILIRFFQCLVHFCIAMAWPPRGSAGAPHEEEKIPADMQERMKKEQIIHGDMHVANVMIGSLNPEGGGHSLVPILKLIDFDRAVVPDQAPGVNSGVAENIENIGSVMRVLITKGLFVTPRPGNVTVTIAGTQRTFFTQDTDLTPAQYRNLDPEIAALVQWCLSHPATRPSLELLDFSVTDLMTRATPDRYAGYSLGMYESDDEIRQFVQEHILDADN